MPNDGKSSLCLWQGELKMKKMNGEYQVFFLGNFY
jgi:hypothetical protein